MSHARLRHTLVYLLTAHLIAFVIVSATIQPRPGGDGSSKWSADTRKGKGSRHKAGPTPGFTGGSGLDNNNVPWCTSRALPGCQSCPDGTRCTACWQQYPNGTGSRFVPNHFTGQCDCPPGYGRLPTPPPATWPSRHLLLAPQPAELPSSDTQTAATNATAVNETAQATLQDVRPGLLLPDPLPSWASSCLPCPVDYYSAGGQQGFAECKPCPGSYTTAWATGAATCIFPYCGPGQEPTRRTGRCRQCPMGTYSFSASNNQPCYPCPKGYTTAAPGSKTYTDCRVPICGPGQELDLDLLVCLSCRGNSISPGGRQEQGTAQPRCQECPFGTAANATRAVCLQDACPYPDNFAIICRTENLLNQTNFFPCGPNGKPASVSQYCTAYPPGSQLGLFQPSDIRAALTTEGINGILLPPEITCPAGANSTTVKYPVIVSFNGRTDCLCRVGGGASCWFVSGPAGATEYSGGTAASRLIDTSISLTIPDPQAASLKSLVSSMAGTNSTAAYSAASGGYCSVSQGVVSVNQYTTSVSSNGEVVSSVSERNWINPLQVNCTGPYITRIALEPGPNTTTTPWASNGKLPNAFHLQGLSQLRILSCIGCSLDGTLPRDWGTESSLMELRVLDLQGNDFTGTLPETWGYMVNLAELTLSSLNSTTLGKIPAAWGLMRSLAFVNMTGAWLDTDGSSCAPWQWKSINGLVANQTFLPPSNYLTMPFCDAP